MPEHNPAGQDPLPPGTPDRGARRTPVAGVVLAAGAGRRMGAAKALVTGPDGTAWVVRAARVVAEGGCTPVLVVVGAEADRVRVALADEPVEVVEAVDWAEGMGASLRAGLEALEMARDDGSGGVVAALVVPVDVPGLTVEVVRRVRAEAGRTALVRAVYRGVPGHPVLLGRKHWPGVVATAGGDQGARAYLRTHPPDEVECADLAEGRDVDRREELPPGHSPG